MNTYLVPRQSAPRRMAVGISGASGFIYGLRLLDVLRELQIETHVVVTRAALLTMKHETAFKLSDVEARADLLYRSDDFAASISSGSFKTMGMIVAPCSMKTLAEIAQGVTSGLVSRAAEVTLKERRKLVLMTRETPLTQSHLTNMLTVTQMGAIVAPPVPAFYTRPTTIGDIVDQTLGRVLDLFDLDAAHVQRWVKTP